MPLAHHHGFGWVWWAGGTARSTTHDDGPTLSLQALGGAVFSLTERYRSYAHPHPPQAPLMSAPVSAADRKCPTCGDYYDISDPGASYPHNNGLCA